MRMLIVRALHLLPRTDSREGNRMSRSVSSVEAGQAYMELHHQAHRIMERAMSGAGLSLGRAKVLMRLGTHGPMNQATLAGEIYVVGPLAEWKQFARPRHDTVKLHG